MAQDEVDDDAVEMLDTVEDNAKGLTSAMVVATTVVLLLAFIVMQKAIGNWFNLGPFAP